MAYSGTVVPIPLGQGGLHTDDSPSSIPPTDFLLANNISLHTNLVEKMAGSQRLNVTQVTGGVFALFDFWQLPSLIANRILVLLGGDGKTYAMDNAGVVTEITAAGGAPATLAVSNQCFMVSGGNESAAANKKLFIFSGANVVQVVTAGTGVRHNIATPPVDWSGSNQPSFGIIYKNALLAGGNANSPHTLYQSLTTNHEDFTGVGSQQYQIYPGDAERLIGATIYKGRLFVFKYPSGAYQFDDTNGVFRKSALSFGFASAHSVVSVLNDVLVKNAADGITSIAATLEFGDVQIGDVLGILRIEQYVRENTNPAGALTTHGIYYPEKKVAMFTYQSTVGASNDRILMFRVDTSGKPKATFVTKDAPNCLALRKDSSFIERPIYGSLDGFVYQMDLEDRNVNGIAYTGEFQTPQLDFGFHDYNTTKGPVAFASKNKNFDFLELRYVPQGNWNLYADIYIDGNLSETVTFPMIGDATLADNNPDPNDFILSDSSTDPTGSFLAGEDLLTVRKRIRGTGRTISVRFYNSGLNQTFKLATMIFSFRLSGEQQR